MNKELLNIFISIIIILIVIKLRKRLKRKIELNNYKYKNENNNYIKNSWEFYKTYVHALIYIVYVFLFAIIISILRLSKVIN